MNTLELKEKAKVKIDEISNDVDSFKVKADQVSNRLRDEWQNEVRELEKSRHSLNDIYNKISKANEESVRELRNAFDKESRSAERRIDHLNEIYSKTLN